LSAVLNSVQAVTEPPGNACPLGRLTYGAQDTPGEWQQFIDALPHLKTTLYRDQFFVRFPQVPIALPAILLAEEGRDPAVLVGREQISQITTGRELAQLVESRLAAFA
jgi:hypothetical protein